METAAYKNIIDLTLNWFLLTICPSEAALNFASNIEQI